MVRNILIYRIENLLNMLVSRFRLFIVIMISTLCWSCTDEVVPDMEVSGEGIHFGASVADDSWKSSSRSSTQDCSILIQEKTSEQAIGLSLTVEEGISSLSTDVVVSRGSQYLSNTLNEFKVAAYYFNDNTVRDYFVDTNGKNGLLVTDGVNPENTKYWPFYGTLDFLAISPTDVVGEMPSATSYNSNVGVSFTYTIDANNVGAHTDIMAAVANDKTIANANSSVPLQFEHLLSAVQFKVGNMLFIEINSITIEGVKGGIVTFTYKKTTDEWEYTASKDNETYILEEGLDTYGLPVGADITGNEKGTMLFVMPQILTLNAKLIVNYDNMLTQERGLIGECALVNPNISGSNLWEAGKTYAYSLNIGTTFDVTIPAPTNQDAHYVMVPMPYRFGNLSGITNITASVEYVNNTDADGELPTLKLGSTNPTKTNLKDLDGLTELQKLGYWTDKRYTSKEDASASRNGDNVRGEQELKLTNQEGTIVMFLPENTGKTDRDVILNIKGQAKVGVQNIDLFIGKCNFKQLCPSWVEYNGGYIGSERIEEKIYANDDGVYPYGFNWNRKVTYKNGTWGVRVLYSDAIASLIGNVSYNTSGTFKVLNGFVEYKVEGSTKYISEIVLDYSTINNLKSVAYNESDGFSNTDGLYNFTAGVNPSELEASLDRYVKNFLLWPILSKTVNNSSTASSEYAAFTAVKRNKFNEISTTFEDDGETVTTYVAELTNEGIHWYLPSINEGKQIKDAGNYDLNSDYTGYWSSTGYGEDNAFAYYFQYNPNGENTTDYTDRTTERRVRAVVKWDGNGSPLGTN